MTSLVERFEPPLRVDKRRYPRLTAASPAILYQGPWYRRKKVTGKVPNWSETGFCFETTGLNSFSKTQPIFFKANTATLKGAPSKLEGTIIRSHEDVNGTHRYGIRFSKTLKEYQVQKRSALRTTVAGIFTVAMIAVLISLKIQHVQWFWYSPFFRLYTLMVGFFIGTRLFFSLFYREPKDRGYMPPVSIIIAVKNEEAHIAQTVHHCFSSHYPMDRFEVLVVDDGSTDHTWEALERLKPQYQNLKLIKFPVNKGKRHAMAAGAEAANGDILIYIDSDSLVETEGIYRIVQPFFDPAVGAVAGQTKVVIESHNVISKMESVRYFISHQLFKTAESIFGAVTCCPGAFSAYRRSYVLDVLPAWLNQTFLGRPATFGDDRSLTNYILRKSHVLYHAGAVCHTYVPQKWSQFFRQQLRWKKSWARETTIAARIMHRKHPLAALFYYAGIVLTMLSPIVFLRATVYAPLVLLVPATPYLLGVFFVYLSLCLIYFIYTGKSGWYCGMLFAAVYMAVLCWQTYYAVLTVRQNHWGTR